MGKCLSISCFKTQPTEEHNWIHLSNIASNANSPNLVGKTNQVYSPNPDDSTDLVEPSPNLGHKSEPINLNSANFNQLVKAAVVVAVKPLEPPSVGKQHPKRKVISNKGTCGTANDDKITILDAMKQICNELELKLISKKPIGSGGFGEVYRVKKPKTGVNYVMKCAIDDPSRPYVAREMGLLSTMQCHPNVIRYYGSYKLAHRPWMSFMLFESLDRDLFKHIASKGKLSLHSSQFATIVRSIGGAICAMHQHNIVHHDIKPENIMLRFTSTGEVAHCALIDFGLAQKYSSSKSKYLERVRKPLTGTRVYMPPEVLYNYLINKLQKSAKNNLTNLMKLVNPYLHDTYAFACTIAFMLVGADLFVGVEWDHITPDGSDRICRMVQERLRGTLSLNDICGDRMKSVFKLFAKPEDRAFIDEEFLNVWY